MRAFLTAAVFLIATTSFAGRKFTSGPTMFYATFNRDVNGGTWTSGQSILKSELIAITNASTTPQTIKITALVEGLSWVLYRVGSPEQPQDIWKIRVNEGAQEAGQAIVPSACTITPPICTQVFTPVRLAAHQTKYRSIGLSFIGPLVNYNDAPHMRLQGSIRYIFEIEEDRGAVYASAYNSMNVGMNAVLFDSNSVFLNPFTIALNGGRPF